MSEMNTATTLQDDPWAASSVQDDAATPVTNTPADAVVDDPWAASSVQADGYSDATDASADPWGGSTDAPDTSMDWLSALISGRLKHQKSRDDSRNCPIPKCISASQGKDIDSITASNFLIVLRFPDFQQSCQKSLPVVALPIAQSR